LKRLKGLHISHDPEKCVLCDACVEECFMEAVSRSGGEIAIEDSKCKGCGRCVAVCQARALNVCIDDPDAAVSEIMGRIDSLIDFRNNERHQKGE